MITHVPNPLYINGEWRVRHPCSSQIIGRGPTREAAIQMAEHAVQADMQYRPHRIEIELSPDFRPA